MNNKDGRRQKYAGFTFVETLAALAVGAVLAAGAGVSAVHMVEYARRTSARNQIEAFKSALQSYYIDCGSFPSVPQGLDALWNKPVLVPVPPEWNGPYLERAPQKDPWGNTYVYTKQGNAACPSSTPENLPFVIVSYGADGTEGGAGNDADIISWQ